MEFDLTAVDHVTRKTVERADAVAIPAVYNGDWANFVGKHVDLFTGIARKPGEVPGLSVPFVGDAIREQATEAFYGFPVFTWIAGRKPTA